MKIKSGNITTRMPFIAVDATDKETRLTGLDTFTVFRDRNGAGPIQMSSPTIIEASSVNMPGLYWLLVNEDTTLEDDVFEHNMVLQITHAGMFPVWLSVEIQENKADSIDGRLPDALEDGFMKSASKKIGLTILGPGGAGGQKYGG